MMPLPGSYARMDDGRPTLVVATANPGKLAEFRSLLGDEVVIKSLDDIGLTAPEETGSTFEENAVLKARSAHQHTGAVTLADDSGLEVDALGGLPGVRSARFASDHQYEGKSRHLLLHKLSGVPKPLRGARFVAVLAIVDASGTYSLYRGTCEGTIADAERGSGGFGYDSVFELPDGRTMAELTELRKNAVSHRARAISEALPRLREALGLAVKVPNVVPS